jgi:hypothetical protein
MRWFVPLIFCLLIVSAAFAQEDKDKEIEKALEEKSISLNFADVGLEDVLGFLKDVSGLNIVLDNKSDKGQTVTLRVNDMKLKNVLKLIGDSVNMTHAVKDGVVHFATKERLKEILAQAADKAYDLESGLQKGREFTCVVSSTMSTTDNAKNMKAEMTLEIEGKVKDVSQDGTARVKGKAKGSASMESPLENQKQPIKEKKFESDITKLWGFREMEDMKTIIPGFEPQTDILPGKPVKAGDEWESNLTRTLSTFLFLMMSAPTIQPEDVPSEAVEKAIAQQLAMMIKRMKATATMKLVEVKDGIAIIEGAVKEVNLGVDSAPTVDPKMNKVRIEFDTNAGAMTLFESKLRLTMPGEGDAILTFRQEIKLKEPRKEPEYGDEGLKEQVGKSDVVAAVEVVVFEKRETYNYYVVEILSLVKGPSGKQHLDVLASEGMEFDKGEKFIMFLSEIDESGRKMYRLLDPQKGLAGYTEELFKRVTEAAENK